jgi:hypothetical protein
VSVLFDGPARRLLSRAYARPGVWVMTRLADPSPRHVAWAAERGINANGPDNPSVAGGRGLNARSRWARAFVRALNYQHKWYSGGGQAPFRTQLRTAPRSSSALRIEVGRHIPASPRGGFPAGRAVRVQLARGGQAKARAVRRLPDSARIWTDEGEPAARFSRVELRDW